MRNFYEHAPANVDDDHDSNDYVNVKIDCICMNMMMLSNNDDDDYDGNDDVRKRVHHFKVGKIV